MSSPTSYLVHLVFLASQTEVRNVLICAHYLYNYMLAHIYIILKGLVLPIKQYSLNELESNKTKSFDKAPVLYARLSIDIE